MAVNHTDRCKRLSGTTKNKVQHAQGRCQQTYKDVREQNMKRKLVNAIRVAKAGRLRTQKRTHSREKPFECDKWGKCFRQAGHLTAHKMTQIGEKPFECEQCCK